MIVDPQHFTLMWSRQARDIIALHRGYVRVTGDVGVGAALSQILYWFDTDGSGQPRARVIRAGELWLAKSAEDLAVELGLVDDAGRPRAKVARRYIHNLRATGLIDVEVRRFNGAPTTHIRPVWEVIADRISCFAQTGISDPVNSQTGIPNCPNGHPDLPTVGKSRTENTTKTTTRTTTTPVPVPAPVEPVIVAQPDTAPERQVPGGSDADRRDQPNRLKWAPFFEHVGAALGVSPYKAGGQPLAFAAKAAGQFGGAAGHDVQKAIELFDAFAAWARRAKFGSGMRWDYVDAESLQKHAGKFIAGDKTTTATGRSVSAVSTYGSNPDDPSGLKAYLARQNAMTGRPPAGGKP